MKTNFPKSFLVCAVIFLNANAVAPAQDTEKMLERKQAALEKQRLELEKRSLALQQKELELEKARQEIQQAGARSMSINLSGDVLFDYDKAALKPAAEESLKKVAVVLSLFPDSTVVVEGYTDSKGPKSVNVQLSRERALAVKDWLVKNGGVSSTAISAKGFGEQNPVASNANADGSDNPVGRAKNRRVSIIVEKPPPPPSTPSTP
jgi:outer membrane protein OmpA-like peptidoglycan-associated protein